MDRANLRIGDGDHFKTDPDLNEIKVAGQELRCLYARLSHEIVHTVINKLIGKKVFYQFDDLLISQKCTEENIRDFYPLFYPWTYIWEKNRR